MKNHLIAWWLAILIVLLFILVIYAIYHTMQVFGVSSEDAGKYFVFLILFGVLVAFIKEHIYKRIKD